LKNDGKQMSGVQGDGKPPAAPMQKSEALSSGKSIRPKGARFDPLLTIWTRREPRSRVAPSVSVARTEMTWIPLMNWDVSMFAMKPLNSPAGKSAKTAPTSGRESRPSCACRVD